MVKTKMIIFQSYLSSSFLTSLREAPDYMIAFLKESCIFGFFRNLSLPFLIAAARYRNEKIRTELCFLGNEERSEKSERSV